MKKKIFLFFAIIMGISLPLSLIIQQYYTKDFYFNHKTAKVTEYLETVEETLDKSVTDESKKVNIISTLFLKFRMIPVLVITEDNEVMNYLNKYLFTDELLEEVQKNYIDEDLLKELIINWSMSVDEPAYKVHKIGDQKVLIVCYPSKTGEKLILLQFNQWVEEFVGVTYAFIILSNITVFITLIIFSFLIFKRARKTMVSFRNKVENIGNMQFEKFDAHLQGPEEFKELQKAFNVMSDKLKQTIDELNRVNNQLEDELENKRKLELQRKQFVSDVSHELKTPIAILQSYSEAIMDDVGDRDFYIKAIFDEANNMEYLVKALLELSKIDSGNVKLNLQRINIVDLLNKEIKLLTPITTEHENKVILKTDRSYELNVDVKKLEQIIRNLFINALQHGVKHKDIIIDIHDTNNNYIEICFYNELDRPMNEEQLKNIFNRFYKVDESRKRGESGAGLGLAIVKDIIELHGGYCKAEIKDQGIEVIIAFKKI